MRRRLAVPLAIKGVNRLGHHKNVIRSTMKLKVSAVDAESQRLLGKLAENRTRIDDLEREIWECSEVDCTDIVEEIDFLRANIELGLVEIAGGLEEIPSSDEIIAEAMA